MPRIVRFELPGQKSSWGVQTESGIKDLGNSLALGAKSLVEAISRWDELSKPIAELSRQLPAVDGRAKLLCPVESGGKIICIGLNYRDHAIESGQPIPPEPVVFCKFSGTLCGPGDIVPLPVVSQQVDYEAELVIVIGKRAWQIGESEADNAIFGYACGHDVSARDWQLRKPGGQWLLGKSFPNFAPLGPAIVTKDLVGNPSALSIQLRINGETMQSSSTQQLIFSPVQIISYLSQCTVLEPGDVIFTGTPPGVGAARKPPRFLKSGDVCEVEVENIGVLSNEFR